MQTLIYDQITASIIAELEKGAAPWVKPWKADGTADRNLASGNAYKGINRLILGMQFKGSNTWATYKQWQDVGASVRKGEKGTHIVYFSPITKHVKNSNGEDVESTYRLMKTYCVFNADQVDGYSAPVVDAPAIPFDSDALCESRIIKTGAIVSHGGDAAFYAPSQDRIQLPNKTAFDTPASYYSTAFHELTHWTGSKNRLDRIQTGSFGSKDYAFEELVAELGAAFLCQEHGISGELRHAGYIQSWLKALRDDNKLIFKAAAHAQKASDFILSLDATTQSVAA